MTVEQKFAKILLSLREILPYYSTFYEALPKKEEKTIDTMGVTSDTLYYNYDFVDNRCIDELIFIVLHEIVHIALLHPVRIESRDPEIWNIACDLYANKLLSVELKGLNPGRCNRINGIDITFPKDGLYEDKVDLKNDSVDIIYEKLLQNKNENKNCTSFKGKGIALDNMISDLISSGNTSLDLEKARKLLEDVQVRNQMSGNTIGNIHCNLQTKVENILKSEVDWKKLLSKYCRNLINSSLSFSSPDKRMMYQSAIYPGKHKEISNYIKGIKICIDSSGSISSTDISYFLGQVEDILKKFKLDAELIWWDTEITSQGRVKSFRDAMRVDVYGGGGTDPSCLFEYFDSKECVDKPYVILVFTDLYWNESNINNPKWKKKYKNTIWIGTKHKNDNIELPFGKEAIVKRFFE